MDTDIFCVFSGIAVAVYDPFKAEIFVLFLTFVLAFGGSIIQHSVRYPNVNVKRTRTMNGDLKYTKATRVHDPVHVICDYHGTVVQLAKRNALRTCKVWENILYGVLEVGTVAREAHFYTSLIMWWFIRIPTFVI